MEKEIWKKIEENPKYSVSNKGRVINNRTLHILSQEVTEHGYNKVSLWFDNNKHKKFFVHRLVAKAFLPNDNNLPQVNHKDENKINNVVENLEWCDALYNIEYSLGKTVLQFDKNNNLIAEYKSVREAARLLNISSGAIYDCVNGRHKTSHGYIWKYKNT